MRVTADFKERLEEAARQEGRPASEIVRQLIVDWLRAHYADLAPGEGGPVRVQEVSRREEPQAVSSHLPVLCWACHQRIDWRVDLGPQGYCPRCGAFIDVRMSR